MTTHKCPAKTCTRQVPNDQFACRTHWVKLPWRLRTNITEAWRVHDAFAHTAAMSDAFEWYRTHDVDAAPESRGGYTTTTVDTGASPTPAPTYDPPSSSYDSGSSSSYSGGDF